MLARAYSQNGEKRAERLIFDMHDNKVWPDEHICGTIVSGYCKEGKMADPLRILYKMEELGVHPNLVIFKFRLSIKGYLDIIDTNGAAEAKMDHAVRFCEKMHERGTPLDLKTYETSEAKQPWKAEELVITIEERGVAPEMTTKQLVADAWLAVGSFKDASRIINGSEEESGPDQKFGRHMCFVSIYRKHKLSASHSNLLPTHEVEVAPPVRTANGNIRSQMIAKASDNMRNAAVSTVLSRSTSLRVQPLIVSRQQIQNQIVRPFRGCCKVASVY